MNQKRPRVFYGWWIVGACFLISLYTAGVVFFGFTAAFEPMANEFGWSYAQISLAASLRGLETGLLAPLIGYLTDRWGPRKLLFGGIAITGFGLLLFSRVTSLGMFYGAFVLIAIGTGTCSGTLFLTTVVSWFRRNVAIATGITTSGFALGGLLVPLVALLIDTFGWRVSMIYLGLGMWIVGLPLSLIVRHKPEKYGYLPDGDQGKIAVAGRTSTSAQGTEVNINARQALRTRVFWHISLALLLQSLALNAVVVHVMPYLSTIGVNRAFASLVASAVPITSICGRLGFGWWGDRANKLRLMAIALTLTTLGLLFFGSSAFGGLWLLLPFIICFGLGWGGSVTIRVALLREYFGRSSFGTIHGFTIGVMMFGNIMGPPIAGWVFDTWGSYQIIWFIFAGLTMVSIAIIATTPPVIKKSNPMANP